MPTKLKIYSYFLIISLLILYFDSIAFADQRQKVKLQLKWFHQFQFAGYYAAYEKGFYKKAGIDLEIIEGGPQVDVANEVVSKKADYGVLGSELIIKRSEGKKIVIVAVIMQHSVRALIVRTDSNVFSPTDLAGKKIMLNRNEQAEFLAMFKYEGVPVNSITIIDKDKTANTQFIKGKIAGLNGSVANQPFLFSEKNVSFRLIKPISYGIDFYGDTLFTSENEIRKNPKRVANMRKATIKGWEYALNYPDEIIDIIRKKYNRKKKKDHLKFEADALKKIILPDLVDIGHVNPHRIRRIINIYKELEVISKDIDVDKLLYNPDRRIEFILTIVVILAIITFSVLVISGVLILFNRQLKSKVIEKTEELTRVNKKLTRNINLIYSFIEGSYDPIYVTDKNDRIFMSNISFSRIFNKNPRDLINRTYKDFMDNRTAEALEISDKKVIEQKKPLVCEITIPNGEKDHIFLFSKIFFKDHNNDIGGIFSIGHNISAIRDTEENLRKSEEQLRSITETSPDIIMQLNTDFQIEYVNRPFYGLTKNELIGREYFGLEGKYPPQVKSKLKSVLKDGITATYETETSNSDGDNIILETIAAPNLSSGRTIGITVISRDITLRKKVEEENRKIESSLRQFHKMEAIGTLAGGIAHDFNNILSAVLGYTEIIKYESNGDEGLNDNLNQIINAVLRAKELIKKILSFSRKHEQKYEPVYISEVVTEALDLLRGSIPKSIEIKRDIDENCGYVFGDTTQIHQIVMNLCTNSYQAINSMSGSIIVDLKIIMISSLDVTITRPELTPGKYIKLSVSDTGTGIEKSYIDKIFDPYFTTKSMKDGTGMGLSVVHGIVKNMSGFISVYSEPGKGSKFELIFPRYEGEDKKSSKDSENMSKYKGDENILVVDDEEMITITMKRILEISGYSVKTAQTAIDALKIFKAVPGDIDLVITDMTMPDMDGAELSENLLKLRHDLPIILCSGFSEIIDPQKAKEIGIKAFLSKPVRSEIITAMVRKILDESKNSEI